MAPRTKTRRGPRAIGQPRGYRLAQCSPYFARGLTDTEIATLVGIARQRVAVLRKQWTASDPKRAEELAKIWKDHR